MYVFRIVASVVARICQLQNSGLRDSSGKALEPRLELIRKLLELNIFTGLLGIEACALSLVRNDEILAFPCMFSSQHLVGFTNVKRWLSFLLHGKTILTTFWKHRVAFDELFGLRLEGLWPLPVLVSFISKGSLEFAGFLDVQVLLLKV